MHGQTDYHASADVVHRTPSTSLRLLSCMYAAHKWMSVALWERTLYIMYVPVHAFYITNALEAYVTRRAFRLSADESSHWHASHKLEARTCVAVLLTLFWH